MLSENFAITDWAICILINYLFQWHSEFIGEDGSEKFWNFVDTVKELTVYKQGGLCSKRFSLKVDIIATDLGFSHLSWLFYFYFIIF